MNKSIVLGLALAVSSVSFSQQSFTLEEAKSYALEHHVDVKNAILDIQVAKQQIVETRGMGLPQISMSGQFNNFINLPVQVIDASFFNPNAPEGSLASFKAGTDYSASGSLDVGQLIFNGSYIVGLQASRFYASFQNSAAEVTKESVVFNTIQAYELAAVAKENLDFVDSMVVLTENLIEKQENYLELGLMRSEDMDQLRYSLSTAKDAQLSAQLQYENALNMVKFSIGYPMDQPLEINQTPDELMKISAISFGDIHENLTYNLMEQQVTLSELNVKNNKAASLPSLNAFFSQTYNAYRNEFDFFQDKPWYPQTVWGLQLNVPIFSGLSRHARTQQSKIELLKSEQNLAQMEQTLKFQELQAKNNLESAQNKNALQKENVELARKLYENAVAKKEIGEGNSIVVTQQYNQLMMAQTQYIGSMVDLFQAKLALDKLYNKILSNEQ